MPQVTVTIAGRLYRMACGEGEEQHLQGLAHLLDTRITSLKGDFGEIGDQRIIVMAALTLADQISEMERRVQTLQAEVASLSKARSEAEASNAGLGDAVADALEDAANRIDRLARDMLTTQRLG